MIKKICILICILTSTAFSSLKSDKLEYDFGKVYNIDFVKMKVTLENNGNKSVVLETVRLSCGCTVADYKKGMILKPNETSVITINFFPKGLSGRLENLSL